MLCETRREWRLRGRASAALVVLGLVGSSWVSVARAQAPVPVPVPAAAPRSPWAGYAPGSAWSRYGPATPRPEATQRQVYVAPPAGAGARGWAGYAPGNAWVGYAPARAWTGYVPSGGWRRSPVYGNVPAPSRYQEYGSGRPVTLAKPWLPGSP